MLDLAARSVREKDAAVAAERRHREASRVTVGWDGRAVACLGWAYAFRVKEMHVIAYLLSTI